MKSITRSLKFTLIIGFLATFYYFITPPFQAPDEPNHFFRAFQLSEGKLFGERHENSVGGFLPRGFENEINTISNHMPHDPWKKITQKEWIYFFHNSKPLTSKQTEPREFIPFPNTILYSPVPYLPQILGMLVGRFLSLSLLQTYYLAKLLTLIASITLIGAALKVLESQPQSQLLLFFVTALPMSIFEMTSISADALTNAISFLIFSIGLSLLQEWNKKKFFCYLGSVAFLSMCKNVYIFLPLFIVPFLLSNKTKSRITSKSLTLIAATLCPAVIWSLLIQKNYVPASPGVNPKEQLHFIHEHFFQVSWMLLTECIRQFENRITELIGVLGWLDTYLKTWIYRVFTLILLFAATTHLNDSSEGYQTTQLNRAFTLPLVVQGRYLLPLAPLLLACGKPIIRLSFRIL